MRLGVSSWVWRGPCNTVFFFGACVSSQKRHPVSSLSDTFSCLHRQSSEKKGHLKPFLLLPFETSQLLDGLETPSYANFVFPILWFSSIFTLFPPSVLTSISTHLSYQLEWCRKGSRITGNQGWSNRGVLTGVWRRFSGHTSGLEGFLTKVRFEEVSEETWTLSAPEA